MRHVVIGTAGHIDHGKSTLVRALTGIDPDRLKEEKARGITIDLGFAHDVRGDVTLAFVDVPGHERFVKNMLAGATGIDVVLLVIAADESVMPQTREHLDICRLLQIRRGVVAITKADVTDTDTIELVKLEVRDLVAGSFMADAPMVAVSAVSGEGLDALRAALLDAAADVTTRRSDEAFRLPIDRVFSIKGFGTVVTGTIISGRARIDDALEIEPTGHSVKVRALQAHGTAVDEIGAGQRAAINLSGIELTDVTRGDCLVSPGSIAPTRRVDAVLDVLATARPLKHGARVRFHQGTGEALGRVAVSQVLDPVDAEPPGPVVEIPAGAHAYVRIRLEKPVVLTRGDRFVLRAYSPATTIAGGLVLDPEPPRCAIRTAAGRQRFARLDPGPHGDPRVDEAIDRTVWTFMNECGSLGLPVPALIARGGLSSRLVESTVRRLSASGAVVVIGDLLVARAMIEARAEGLLRLLSEYHRAQPLSEGMPREEARERVLARADPAVFEAVVQMLVGSGRIRARERLSLATHQMTLSVEDEQARTQVAAAFRTAGLRPPVAATLAAELGLSAIAVDHALTVLQRQKTLIKIDDLWFHAEALEQLKSDVRALKNEPQARVDVASFKARYGVSRKFAIPLLEYLDRERVTRRMGDSRVIL